MSRQHEPVVLVLGSSGRCATALLHLLADRLPEARVVGVDPAAPPQRPEAVSSLFLAEHRERLDVERGELPELVATHGVDVVVDLATEDQLALWRQASAAGGVSVVNTTITTADTEVWDRMQVGLGLSRDPAASVHVFNTGMNPGIVGYWAVEAAARWGRPEEVVIWEYDDTTWADGWQPGVTWEVEDFIAETFVDAAMAMDGRGQPRFLDRPAIEAPEALAPLLAGAGLDVPPEAVGMTVPHEELVTIAEALDCPARFLYALHPRTVDHVARLHLDGGVRPDHLDRLVNLPDRELVGRDRVAALLRYPERSVHIVNRRGHGDLPDGTNGTALQVAAGAWAGLATVLEGRLEGGVYFPEDLVGTGYGRRVRDVLEVEEIVVEALGEPAGPG